jgi:hypothetical protein
LGELVPGTMQIIAMTVFFEQFKFRRYWLYLTPVEPAANTYVAARHFFTSNLGLDLQDKVSRQLVSCNEHAYSETLFIPRARIIHEPLLAP